MIRQAWLTLPSCFASSSTPTLLRMIFSSLVIVSFPRSDTQCLRSETTPPPSQPVRFDLNGYSSSAGFGFHRSCGLRLAPPAGARRDDAAAETKLIAKAFSNVLGDDPRAACPSRPPSSWTAASDRSRRERRPRCHAPTDRAPASRPPSLRELRFGPSDGPRRWEI